MRVDRAAYLAAPDQEANVNGVATRSAVRLLRSRLTDQDFEQYGLRLIPIPDASALMRGGNADTDTRNSDHWLVHGVANDGPVDQRDPMWRAGLDVRFAELRAIADEEDLPFDEISAAAAMRFVERLGYVRRPGAFLVGGNLRLLWDAAGGEQVGLQFRGDDQVQYVVFQRDDCGLGSAMGVKSHEAMLRLLALPDIRSIMCP